MYASKALTITYIIQSENINNADGILYFIGPPNSPPGKEITNLVAVRKKRVDQEQFQLTALVVMKNDGSFSCPMVFRNLSQYLIIICACCFNVFKNPGIVLHWRSVVRQIDKDPAYILL